MSTPIVFWNQTFVPEDQAYVPITDRGFLFGDGVFTTIKVCQGTVECYSKHYQRLQQNCLDVGIIPPQIDFSWIKELIERNKALQGIWRLKMIVTGGEGSSLDLVRRRQGQLILTLKPYEEAAGPLRLTVYSHPFARPLARIKSLAYLDRLWIKNYAFSKGFDEALVLESQGYILETAFCNLFWRVGQDVFFPDPLLPLLHGIAAQMIEETAETLGFSCHHVCVKLESIPEKAQLFICNSLKGFCPVEAIDEQVFIRDLEWEKSFRQAYQRLVNECSTI